MSEQEASPGERWRPTPETIATAERMGTAALALEVVGVAEGGGFRRVSFHEPQLGAVEYHPGQDLTFSVPAGVDRSVKRRYTIRNLDRSAARADVEVVLHGDGPGARWARELAVGDRVEAVGPRGKIFVEPDADWHLFLGDESYLPAAFAMAESLPAATTALLVIEHGKDVTPQPLETAAELVGPVWVARRGGGDSDAGAALLEALGDVALPSGRGHAYVGGEHDAVYAVRDALVERGLDPLAVSAKPYWRVKTPNADHGEPLRD